MSVLIKGKTTGEWIQVAGNGKAEYGASTVRNGTFVYSLTDNAPISKTIAFDSAMPDSDYLLEIDTGSSKVSCGNITKSASGFTCFLRNNDSAEVADRTFSYTAFKLYTDTEYNEVLDDVENLKTVTNGNLTVANNGLVSVGSRIDSLVVVFTKVGKLVTLSVQAHITSDPTAEIFGSLQVAVLAEKYRPLQPIGVSGVDFPSAVPYSMTILPDGNISVLRWGEHYSEAGNFAESATYISAK